VGGSCQANRTLKEIRCLNGLGCGENLHNRLGIPAKTRADSVGHSKTDALPEPQKIEEGQEKNYWVRE